MSNQTIRISEIPTAAKSKGFGPFTSEVSATAILSLLVVLGVLLFGSI